MPCEQGIVQGGSQGGAQLRKGRAARRALQIWNLLDALLAERWDAAAVDWRNLENTQQDLACTFFNHADLESVGGALSGDDVMEVPLQQFGRFARSAERAARPRKVQQPAVRRLCIRGDSACRGSRPA